MVERYSCGAGDGMFEDREGHYVEYLEYERLKGVIYDLAYNNSCGLPDEEVSKLLERLGEYL